MIVIGIDPGLTGAIAALDDNAQLILCADLPVIRSGKLAWIDSNELTSLLMQCRDGRPGQILVLGSILAACQRVAVPLHIVTAAVWKRSLGLGADKSASLDKARLLFPAADLDRVKDHNRAEALLLAYYGLCQQRSAAA